MPVEARAHVPRHFPGSPKTVLTKPRAAHPGGEYYGVRLERTIRQNDSGDKALSVGVNDARGVSGSTSS